MNVDFPLRLNTFVITSGSRLYGTAHADSDYDYRGVYVESVNQMLGLQNAKILESKEPDVVLYPLRRFIHLALQGNPNILEILFAGYEHWESKHHQFFLPFVHNRHAFLSQRCRQTYIDYARSQLKMTDAGKSPSSNTRQGRIQQHGYDTKHAAHTARLLLQGRDILITGDFNPTLEGKDAVIVRGILNGVWPKEDFLVWAQARISVLKELVARVPEQPNFAFVEQLLIECYRKYL